jgi:hypothetical protein
MGDPNEPRTTLRDLSFSSRLVLSAFLISVGVGYFSALVQLHFQHAAAGEPLPGPKDAEHIYYGHAENSQLERLLLADEHRPFNGTGSMASAFTSRGGLDGAARRRADEKKVDAAVAEAEVRKERDGERFALIAWIRAGANEEAYNDDKFKLEGDLATQPVTEKFLEADDDKKDVRYAKIKSILDQRCARCHKTSYSGSPSNYPLEKYSDVKVYTAKEWIGGMSLTKLAQSTHVHLLGFSMLYGLTGLIFTFTSFPALIRFIIGPLALVAQIADVSCWWLARMDPYFAKVIMITGGIVAVSLGVQIVGSLFDMFEKKGKAVIFVLIVAAGVGGFYVKQQVIDPHLAREKAMAVVKPG